MGKSKMQNKRRKTIYICLACIKKLMRRQICDVLLRRLRQHDLKCMAQTGVYSEFEAKLGYRVRPYLKNKHNRNSMGVVVYACKSCTQEGEAGG
jgi:hypothetical protein